MDLASLFLDDPRLARQGRRIPIDPLAPFPVLVAKIKLTWQCNLRCGICALWRLGAKGEPKIQPLTTDLVREILTDLTGQGLKKVHFSGGEILLRPDLEAILENAAQLGLQVNLTTNGTLLDKDAARFIVDHRIHTVAFSIDEASEKKHDAMRGRDGAWRMTWKGIDRLISRKAKKGRGPVVAVNTVVTRRNTEHLPALFSLLRERGVERWRLLPVRTPDKKLRPRAEQWLQIAEWSDNWKPMLDRRLIDGRSSKNARLAAKGLYAGRSLDAGLCFAPWFSVFIDADGRVFPCCTGRKEIRAGGTVAEQGISDILNSNMRQEILAGMASAHFYEVCRSCDEFLEENLAFAQAAGKEPQS